MGGVFLTSFRRSLALKGPLFGTRTSHRCCRQSKERITRTPSRVTQYSSRIERLFPICDHVHPSSFSLLYCMVSAAQFSGELLQSNCSQEQHLARNTPRPVRYH